MNAVEINKQHFFLPVTFFLPTNFLTEDNLQIHTQKTEYKKLNIEQMEDCVAAMPFDRSIVFGYG